MNTNSSNSSDHYVLQSEINKKAFKDLFGCDASKFTNVKVYVDGQGYGQLLISVLKECGMDVSSFMKHKNGITLHND